MAKILFDIFILLSTTAANPPKIPCNFLISIADSPQYYTPALVLTLQSRIKIKKPVPAFYNIASLKKRVVLRDPENFQYNFLTVLLIHVKETIFRQLCP